MAYSYVDLVASAGQQNFPFSIPYLSRDNISVFQNGVLLDEEDWTFLMAQVIRLDVGAADADVIRVRRVTPIDEPIVDYSNGSVLGETQLDSTALQSLYVAQEVADDAENTIHANASLRWDALSRRIINVATPVDPTDAVNKAYADDVIDEAETSAAAAAASAATASTQATNATSSASSAASSASAASASAADAALSASKLKGTSTTSLLIEVASKVFTTQAGKFFDPGVWVLITSDANPANFMHGQVTAYSGTTLTVNVTNIGGSGTRADWTIYMAGTRGAVGATGATGATGPAGADGEDGEDGEDGSSKAGPVRMMRTASGVWEVLQPDGTNLDISSSTTDGLQEAIDYACDNGYDLEISGGGIIATGPEDVTVIHCTTGIVFPPMQNKKIKVGACTVNFSAAVTGTGVRWDSCMMVDVDWGGQIVYTGNGAAVLFKPENDVPYDAVTAIIDSKFRINHVAVIGGTNPDCIQWDATNGPIIACINDFIELNCLAVAGSDTMVFTNPTAGIIGNQFRCPHVHDYKDTGIKLGTSTTNAANIHSNIFDVQVYGTGATCGISIYGTENIIRGAILNNEGAITTGIVFQSSAAGNQLTISRNNGTTKVTDNSTAKNNFINGVVEFEWVPALTFETPGNLSVTYTNRFGYGQRIGNQVTITFLVQTATFTHTTASGKLKITGLPYTARNVGGLGSTGALLCSEIDGVWAYLVTNIEANENFICVLKMNDATPADFIVANTEVPTGEVLTFRSTMTYTVDP